MKLERKNICWGGKSVLGPRQTSDFDKQYCDKKIMRYCDKKTIFQQYFSSSCELKNSIHGYFSWFWKTKAIFCQKIIALSQYRFIAISQYCLQKLLVCRGPYLHYVRMTRLSKTKLGRISNQGAIFTKLLMEIYSNFCNFKMDLRSYYRFFKICILLFFLVLTSIFTIFALKNTFILKNLKILRPKVVKILWIWL
jgi:hypothetical protein